MQRPLRATRHASRAIFTIALISGCGSDPTPAEPQRGTTDPASAQAPASAVPSASATIAPSAAPAAIATADPAACAAPCSDIERCDAETHACVPACPEGSVFVPPTGTQGFLLGHNLRPPGDRAHKVILTKPFCMDANEITAGDYESCVKEGACSAPKTLVRWVTYGRLPKHPIINIDWRQARAFCQHHGKDLPTEAQWEWAATGGDGRKWPWGNEQPTCEHADFTIGTLPTPSADAGCHGGGPSEVGTHPKGDREWPSGKIHDLAGNVWEWCLDNYQPYPANEETDPLHMPNIASTHVVRGGGWNRSVLGIQTAYRGGAVVDYQRPGLGARCVKSPR